MDEFEVHLLSTASLEVFGDNTLAAFKNQLPQKYIWKATGVWLYQKLFSPRKLITFTQTFVLRSHYQKERR